MTCQRTPWKTKATNHISQEPLSVGAPLHQSSELAVGEELSMVHIFHIIIVAVSRYLLRTELPYSKTRHKAVQDIETQNQPPSCLS